MTDLSTADFSTFDVGSVLRADFTVDESGGSSPSPGGTCDYEPYCYDVSATSPDTVIGGLAPFGYWKLNDASGAPQDSSGNGNHATAAHATLTYAQAPLSAKGGNSIALSAGGRIHFPGLTGGKHLNSPAADYTIVMLLMITGAGDGNPNGVIFLSESQANTVALWGFYVREDLSPKLLLHFTNIANLGVIPAPVYPSLNVPFVLAIRGHANVEDYWVNGVLAGTSGRFGGGEQGSGWDLGANLGDSFFSSVPLRASNVAAWTSALTDAQLTAVCESLMDAPMMAGAWTP